ncbi:MAG: hypothetical protein NTU53_23160 [Planctomycetota bacterium]|nr:hypothetical protein [Planctomycetota bacterium]
MTHPNRKLVAITFILMTMFAVIMWMRGNSHTFDVRTIVPFLDGKPVAIYSFGGLALILLGLWGLSRISAGAGDDGDDSTAEPDEPPDEQPVEPASGKRDSDAEEP